MRAKPFSRPPLIGAIELPEQHSQARFNQLVLRLEAEIGSDTGLSVAKECDLLGRIEVQRTDFVLDTLDGAVTLGEAVVRDPNLAIPLVVWSDAARAVGGRGFG